MRKVILYIAMSLDGYIADKNGGVDWIQGQGDGDVFDTYPDFIKDIDTVILGWNTYQQIITDLSPDKWVYEGMTTYVLTHRDVSPKPDIVFVNDDVVTILNQLKAETGKGIWICGGAEVIRQVMSANLIDDYQITLIPSLLGDGIKLFSELEQEIPLRLLETKTSDGMVFLHYQAR